MGCGPFWRSSKSKAVETKPTKGQEKSVDTEGEKRASGTPDEVALKVALPVRSSRGPSQEVYTAEQKAAAGKIGAAIRGSSTRWQVKEDYHEIRRRTEGSPVEPDELGFSTYAQKNSSMPVVSDHVRFKVRDMTKQRVMEQLGHDEVSGRWNTFESSAARILEKVAKSTVQLPPGPTKQMASVFLFQGEDTQPLKEAEAEGFLPRRQDTYLLGRFQVVAVPATADYDAGFNSIKVESGITSLQPSSVVDCDGPEGFNGWFWVLHTAAPNIGESAQAEDFLAYSVEEEMGTTSRPVRTESTNSAVSTSSRCCWKDRPIRPSRRLNEDLYIADIARLWRNALKAVQYLEVEEAIFFPFGMGAFLRHLNLNDDQYEDPARIRRLKRRIADELMDAIGDICVAPNKLGGKHKAKATSRSRPHRVHLCLVCVNPESIDNHNCFVEAAASKVQSCPELKEVLHLRRNVDALQLAHELGTSAKPLKVALLNGANRKLCGNHWFQSGARYAIDENLHRRSASLSRASLLVNFDTEPRPRKPTQLEENVRFFGGSIVDLTRINNKDSNAKIADVKHVKVQDSIPATPAKEKPKKSYCLCCGYKEKLPKE